MGDAFVACEVEGAVIRGTLNAPERQKDVNAVIAELKSIINQKNQTIEKQTDYIAELQEENRRLRQSVQMLSM